MRRSGRLFKALSVPFNHDTFSFRVPKKPCQRRPHVVTPYNPYNPLFICPLCCPGLSHAILDWNPTSDGNGILSRSLLLAFSLGIRSAPFVSQGMLSLLHAGAMFACNMSAGTVCQLCCCCTVVAICYCSLLRWPILLVVNIIDFVVLAGPLPIPN